MAWGYIQPSKSFGPTQKISRQKAQPVGRSKISSL